MFPNLMMNYCWLIYCKTVLYVFVGWLWSLYRWLIFDLLLGFASLTLAYPMIEVTPKFNFHGYYNYNN